MSKSLLLGELGGSGGFVADAVVFDRTQMAVWSPATEWNNPPGSAEQHLLFVAMFKRTAGSGQDFQLINIADDHILSFASVNNGTFEVSLFQVFSGQAYVIRRWTIPHDEWIRLLYSVQRISDSQALIQVYHGDTEITSFAASSETLTRRYNASKLPIGTYGHNSEPSLNQRFTGQAAMLYFAPGEHLDLSVEANRREFFDAEGNPVDLRGSIGTRVPQPLIFHQLRPDMESANEYLDNLADVGPDGKSGTLTQSGGDAIAFVPPPFDEGAPDGNGGASPEEAILYVKPRWTQAGKGMAIVEASNGDGSSPGSAIAGPERIAGIPGLLQTGLTVQYLPGHYFPFNVAAAIPVITLRSGGGEETRNIWRHGSEGGQATLWGGIVIDGSVTEHGDGTFTLNGALRSNQRWPFFADVGFDGPDNEGVLMREVASVEALQADDQYTYYFPGSVASGQSVRLHMPNGDTPRFRVMQGGFGYRYDTGAATTRSFLDFHDMRLRIAAWPSGRPAPTKTRFFGLTDIKWQQSGLYALLPMHQSWSSANGQRSEDLYFEHIRLEEGRNGLYFVSLQERGFHGVTIDRIEGYNLANRPQYESVDGHVVACEDYGGFNQVTIGEVISRDTGNPIAVHLSASSATSSCHDFLLIGPVDLQRLAAHTLGTGTTLCGITLFGGNGVLPAQWSNLRILTDPMKFSVIKGFLRAINIHWHSADEPILIGYQDADLVTKHILLDEAASVSANPESRGGIGASRSFFDPDIELVMCHSVKVRNVEFGPDIFRAYAVTSNAQHGQGYLLDSNWNLFRVGASEHFFRTPGFGTQTFAQWQGNSASPNVYDPDSVRVDL